MYKEQFKDANVFVRGYGVVDTSVTPCDTVKELAKVFPKLKMLLSEQSKEHSNKERSNTPAKSSGKGKSGTKGQQKDSPMGK